MPPKVDPDAVDFSAVFSALGTNPLHRNATGRLTTLNGSEDYNTWSHQMTTVFRFCGIDKVLTGEWAKPNVTLDDATSVKNERDWISIDAWISMHLGLSDAVSSQVRHLTTSNEKWEELKKLFKPASATSITLHLTSIINVRFDESTKFEEFVATKREHNRLLGELGGQSLPDSYIAILIRSGLPENLKQYVAHLPDDTITTDQLINIIRSRQQESLIQTMQSTSESALLGRHQNQLKKKRDYEPCKTPKCPRPRHI